MAATVKGSRKPFGECSPPRLYSWDSESQEVHCASSRGRYSSKIQNPSGQQSRLDKMIQLTKETEAMLGERKTRGGNLLNSRSSTRSKQDKCISSLLDSTPVDDCREQLFSPENKRCSSTTCRTGSTRAEDRRDENVLSNFHSKGSKAIFIKATHKRRRNDVESASFAMSWKPIRQARSIESVPSSAKKKGIWKPGSAKLNRRVNGANSTRRHISKNLKQSATNDCTCAPETEATHSNSGSPASAPARAKSNTRRQKKKEMDLSYDHGQKRDPLLSLAYASEIFDRKENEAAKKAAEDTAKIFTKGTKKGIGCIQGRQPKIRRIGNYRSPTQLGNSHIPSSEVANQSIPSDETTVTNNSRTSTSNGKGETFQEICVPSDQRRTPEIDDAEYKELLLCRPVSEHACSNEMNEMSASNGDSEESLASIRSNHTSENTHFTTYDRRRPTGSKGQLRGRTDPVVQLTPAQCHPSQPEKVFPYRRNGQSRYGIPVNGMPINGLPVNGLPVNGIASSSKPSKGVDATSVRRICYKPVWPVERINGHIVETSAPIQGGMPARQLRYGHSLIHQTNLPEIARARSLVDGSGIVVAQPLPRRRYSLPTHSQPMNGIPVATKRTNTTRTAGKCTKNFRCTFDGCKVSFSTRFSLKRHMKKHTGERPYACPYNCGKNFAEKSTLTRHVRVHTGKRPYVCKFPGCDKSFADRTNIKRHELLHTGKRPYRCCYCMRGFFYPKQVIKHISELHKDKVHVASIVKSVAKDKVDIPYRPKVQGSE